MSRSQVSSQKLREQGFARASRWVCGDLLKVNTYGPQTIVAFKNLETATDSYLKDFVSVKANLLVIYLDKVAAKPAGYMMNTVFVQVLTGEQILWIPASRCNLMPRGLKRIQGAEYDIPR